MFEKKITDEEKKRLEKEAKKAAKAEKRKAKGDGGSGKEKAFLLTGNPRMHLLSMWLRNWKSIRQAWKHQSGNCPAEMYRRFWLEERSLRRRRFF